MDEPSVEESIEEWWEEMSFSGTASSVFWSKMHGLKERLKVWSKIHFGKAKEKMRDLTNQIHQLDIWEESRDFSDQEIADRGNARAKLNKLIKAEAIGWRQRARVQDIKVNERNTKYFHCIANGRRRANLISRFVIEN
ncbi:hypothetical protein BVC80_8831g19 [Macleaya cordata]|uniref:Uncharacterized protein n=1 Tax=Macleaya cordata TaxID=56857 RepID=A0A200RE25_MACCD|nr:hypothetical protein BVC80_8831g19 [Macleaya cordata]